MKNDHKLKGLISNCVKVSSLALACLLSSSTLSDTLWYSPYAGSASDAKNLVGKKATICGTIASTRFARRSRGQPTYLNLDQAYPDHTFTIVVWGETRQQFKTPPENLIGLVCVAGLIQEFRGVPQITVSDPRQLKTYPEN